MRPPLVALTVASERFSRPASACWRDHDRAFISARGRPVLAGALHEPAANGIRLSLLDARASGRWTPATASSRACRADGGRDLVSSRRGNRRPQCGSPELRGKLASAGDRFRPSPRLGTRHCFGDDRIARHLDLLIAFVPKAASPSDSAERTSTWATFALIQIRRLRTEPQPCTVRAGWT
jgi:hypothetical protein